MAASSFLALAYTFGEKGHIRITLFLENLTRISEDFSMVFISNFFFRIFIFFFIKMLMISYKFQERSEGADEILIWIPQVSVALGSTIFLFVYYKFYSFNFKKKIITDYA